MTYFGKNQMVGALLGIIRDLFLFLSSLLLKLIIFFYIAILKNIFTKEEKRIKGMNKPNIAELILKKDFKDDSDEEEDININYKEIQQIPKSFKTCKEIEKLKKFKAKDIINLEDNINQTSNEVDKIKKYHLDYYLINHKKTCIENMDYRIENEAAILKNVFNLKGRTIEKFKKMNNATITDVHTDPHKLLYSNVDMLELPSDENLGEKYRDSSRFLHDDEEDSSSYISQNHVDLSKNSLIARCDSNLNLKILNSQLDPSTTYIIPHNSSKEIKNSYLIPLKKRCLQKIDRKGKRMRSESIKISKYIFDLKYIEKEKQDIKEYPKNHMKMLNNKIKNLKYQSSLLDIDFKVKDNIRNYFTNSRILDTEMNDNSHDNIDYTRNTFKFGQKTSFNLINKIEFKSIGQEEKEITDEIVEDNTQNNKISLLNSNLRNLNKKIYKGELYSEVKRIKDEIITDTQTALIDPYKIFLQIINKNNIRSIHYDIGVLQNSLNLNNNYYLNKYFINDNKYFEMIDKVYCPKQSNDRNNFEVFSNYQSFSEIDNYETGVKYLLFSGYDVLGQGHSSKERLKNFSMSKLEKHYFETIKSGVAGFIDRIVFISLKICKSYYFQYFIHFVIIINTMLLMLEGNYFDKYVFVIFSKISITFNIIFILEFIIRVIAYRIVGYFLDIQNMFDTLIVCFCIIELDNPEDFVFDPESKVNIWNNNGVSSFKFIKVFRILRTLFYITSNMITMTNIFKGIRKMSPTLFSFAVMFFTFWIIFSNIAFNFFNNDSYFKTLGDSMLTLWHTITFENWTFVVYQNHNNTPQIGIFLIFWIFLENFLIFNLFISIVMDSLEELKVEDMIAPMQKINNILELTETETKRNDHLINTKNAFIEENIIDNSNSDEDDRDLNISNNILLRSSTRRSQEMMEENKEIQKIFKGNYCEESFFIFSQKNWLRKRLMQLITYKYFNLGITVLIAISSLRLVLETYFNSEGNIINEYFDNIDASINVCFILEFLVKCIALGFVDDEGCYIQDNWNKLDFVIVITSIWTLPGIEIEQLSAFRVLKIFRILRPLRIVAKNPHMKLIIASLLDSIYPITSVLSITIMVMIIFSVTCINLIFNLYNTCYVANYEFEGSSLIYWVPVKNFTDYLDLLNISIKDTQKVANLVFFIFNSFLVFRYFWWSDE